MSSQPHPELLALPLELIEYVAKQITDKEDLCNMRMAYKTLDKPAAKQLFKSVCISPSIEAVKAWNSISEHDVLRHMPRDAVIHTQLDTDIDAPWLQEEEYDEIVESFSNTIGALSRYPNLGSVEIKFTPGCQGREQADWEDDPLEDPAAREKILTRIFQAIRDRAANANNQTIRKLIIVNLQNCPIPDFTSSELFLDVMGRLDELHLSLIQEHNEAGPDHDYTKVELQTFPAHLCADWLAPISANLKALSIYHRHENWGPFPGYFDFSGLEFPKLEKLALGYYTFAHENDLDWITAIKTLCKLVLHNCMIASYIRIGRRNLAEWNPPTHDWILMSGEDDHDWCTAFKYEGKWSSYLDRIATGLTNLVDFTFDYAEVRDDDEDDDDDAEEEPVYGLRYRDRRGAQTFSRRYVVFDNGILPTHWPEARENGKLHTWRGYGATFPNLHELYLEEDEKSLRRLLEGIECRR